MTIYQHNNVQLDLKSDKSASLYVDNILIFRGNRRSAVTRFINECNDKNISIKFNKYIEVKRHDLTVS